MGSIASFRNLDRSCKLIEEVFKREKSTERKTFLCKSVIRGMGVL
jgi:hypothetical protein